MTLDASVRVPSRFTAGDSFVASVTPANPYDDPEWGHTLTLVNAARRFTVAGVLDSGVVEFETSATPWAPGRYQWHYTVSDGTDRHTLATGTIDVLPDPGGAAFDPRSHARKVLDAIEAFLERADYEAARTRVADRELQNIPIPELLTLRETYRAEVRSEEAAAGLRPVGRVLVRF